MCIDKNIYFIYININININKNIYINIDIDIDRCTGADLGLSCTIMRYPFDANAQSRI